MAGANTQISSAEKARQAISVLLTNSADAEKAIACKQLAVYGNADAVPALAPLLCDPKLASWARIPLEVIPGRAADDALRDALDKVQGQLLVGVINSIGVRGDTRAVNPLTAKLKDADTEVASAAAIALGRIGSVSAATALERFLTEAPEAVRSAVAQGCILGAETLLAADRAARAVQLCDAVRKAEVPAQRKLEATRGAILARKADGLPLLLETLRSSDQEMFNLGLHTARELAGRNVTDALAAELGKVPSERQVPLLLALADRTDAGVEPVLLATAKSGAKPLRLVAVDLLARRGAPASVPVLLDLLSEGDADLARSSRAALVNFPGDELDKQLCSRLPQASGNTRVAFVELAGQRRVAAAIPELTKAAGDVDPTIRAAGIKSLGETVSVAQLGALTDLLITAKTTNDFPVVQDALESACMRLPDKSACAQQLISRMPAASVVVRCALLRVLGVAGSANALEAVRAATASPDSNVRDTAIRVLAGWPDAAALPSLLELSRSAQEETHRFLALRGCVRLLDEGSQSAAEKLETFTELLSRTDRNDDRKVILSGLGNVRDVAALKLIEPMLANDQIQAEAEMAMLNIANNLVRTAPAEARAVATKLRADSSRQATRDRAARILSELDRPRR
jgi:HEAT repeat protein